MSDHPKRILVFSIRAIGDVALMTPIFRILKQKYPKSFLAVLADGLSAQVLHHNPHVDRLYTIDRAQSRGLPWHKRMQEWLNLCSELRRDQFDLVIDLFSGPRSAILAWCSGAPERYAEDVETGVRGVLYNHAIKIVRDGKHLVEQKLELIQSLIGDIKRENAYLEVCLTKQERESIDHLFSRPGQPHRVRVGLIPGAGSKWRIWPAERFAELGDLLIKNHQVEVFLLGGKDDMTVCRHIGELMRNTPTDLSGKTTLRELLAVLEKLNVVISNVTGPMHLASACSSPHVIGLYGEADTVQYAPWGKQALMVTKGEVNKAYWKKVNYERDHEVLLRITVNDVLEAVQKVLLP